MPQTRRSPGVASGAASEQISGIQQNKSTVIVTDISRRPCRMCRRPDVRPVVPIGSSRWWDVCARCVHVIAGARVAG